MSLRRSRSYRRNLLNTIGIRAAAPLTAITTSLLLGETDRYARSEAVRICTVAKILNDNLPFNVLVDIARTIDVLGPYTGGSIQWHPIPTSTGGSRKVCTLPLPLAVGQVIALDLLQKLRRPRDHIFDWLGRGPHKYVEAAADALRANGPLALIADVRACHANVNPQALYDIDFLPTGLIQSCLDSRQLSFRGPRQNANTGLMDNTGEQTGPRGLLEGGGASNALFAVLIDDLPDYLPAGARPLVYGDNVMVVGSGAQVLEAANEALGRYFIDHPAGPFSIRSELVDVRHGFEQVGYRFTGDDQHVRVGLSHANLIKSVGAIIKATCNIDLPCTEDRLCSLVDHTLSPFGELDGVDRDVLLDQALAGICDRGFDDWS